MAIIEGYKLKKTEYKSAVRSLLGNEHNGWFDSSFDSNEEEFGFNLWACNEFKGSMGEILNEAGVLDLWFDPVFKNRFKIGDFILVLYDGKNDSCHELYKKPAFKGDIVEIVEFKNSSQYQRSIKNPDRVAIGSEGEVLYMDNTSQSFRLALDEEVAARKRVLKIKNHTASIVGTVIIFGCAVLPLAWFDKSDNRGIESMTLSSGVTLGKEEIGAIRNYILEHELNKVK